MAREFSRTHRVADFLRKELALVLQFTVRDPRLTFVSITHIDVSKDLAHAKVYVTLMETEKNHENDVINALNKASGYLRTQLAKRSTMRTTPSLRFIYDQSVYQGSYMSALIDRLES